MSDYFTVSSPTSISKSSADNVTGNVFSEERLDSATSHTSVHEVFEASYEAREFLDNIEESDYDQLLFSEDLVTCTKEGKDLGEFVITVVEGIYNDSECLIIHANSHGSVNDVPCGLSISAHVTKNLETLEQQQHEYVKVAHGPMDRKTVIKKTDDGLLVSRSVTQGKNVSKMKKKIKNIWSQDFISEAANLLLHRLLIKKGLPDDFEVVGFDSDINVCKVTYDSCPSRTERFDDIKIKVKGIERAIHSRKELSMTWQSHFTKQGYLTCRIQVDSPVILRLAALPEQIIRETSALKLNFSNVGFDWYQDMQVLAVFSERKREIEGEHGTYLHNHPDLGSIIVDFVQCLLLHKPQDVLAFAAEYFLAFSKCMPQPATFLSSAKSTPASLRQYAMGLCELRDECELDPW